PVNSLGISVRRELENAIQFAISNPYIRSVIIHGEGRCFSAGADIREFSQPRETPWMSEICTALENSPKPVIAALHGVALGGGLELALAAHYRIADANTQFGLPEVQLGLMPGGGGTQRLPRLIGASVAL